MLTDVKGTSDNAYSEQLITLLGDNKHISETNYFWTNYNFIVDIEKDIDLELENVKKTIKLGAKVKSMYYVDDNKFSGIWMNLTQ